ncbi:Calcium/calmodulin-dependent protein kinase type I [Coemansia sp. RSA 1821]|nr:Calcium/calmodulin-dependent protein kinase type I [Coemansia sp. RSA 1086]KAJ1747667.1 Calcium/calmodulin-dependent protein kinase type I [Coemansia sp. RSA 1821]KAJ2651041.1 Calcium/calmodulin-dependent protein kinase type I [Coemansia sp. RSA 1250]
MQADIQKSTSNGSRQDSNSQSIPCKYKSGKLIGQGTYADVKEMEHIETGQYYAGKIINRHRMGGDTRLIDNEISVMKRLSRRHPNILSLVDHFNTLNNTYLITELCTGGELYNYISRRKYLGEMEAAYIVKQIVCGVKFLHEHNIMHRDLKTENCFVRNDEYGTPESIAIGDFGMAHFVPSDDSRIVTNICGTPGYMAPEMLQRSGHGKPVDMWAVGVITYFVLSGTNPFQRHGHPNRSRAEYEATVNASFDFLPANRWHTVSKAARHFIESLLVVDPSKRMTAKQALEHPWLRNCPMVEDRISESMLNAYTQIIDTHSMMYEQRESQIPNIASQPCGVAENTHRQVPSSYATASDQRTTSMERKSDNSHWLPKPASLKKALNAEHCSEHQMDIDSFGRYMPNEQQLDIIPESVFTQQQNEIGQDTLAALSPITPGNISNFMDIQNSVDAESKSRYHLRPRHPAKQKVAHANHPQNWLLTPAHSATNLASMMPYSQVYH